MADRMTLNVEKRSALGKGELKALRASGMVPGVFYTHSENLPVQVPEMPLTKAYRKVGLSQIFDLGIAGGASVPSLIKDIHLHPVKNRIVHVDFYGVDLSKKLRVMVPVETTGNAPGIDKGGVLELFRDHVEIECLPGDIPERLTVDVSGLDMNDTVLIDAVPLPPNVTAVYDSPYAVAGVTLPSAQKEEAKEAAAAAAEAAATGVAATAEPAAE